MTRGSCSGRWRRRGLRDDLRLSKVRLAEVEGGGLAGPLARTEYSLAYDPVHQRILVFGWIWQTTKGEKRTGDVWAYDAPTNTWTELVRPLDGQQ